MDLLLPVAPGGIDGTGRLFGPRYWRDIPRSDAIEIDSVAAPMSLDEVKAQVRPDTDADEDEWFVQAIETACRQVEADTNTTLPIRTLVMTFDQYPIERWMPLPRPPVRSVASVTYVDVLTGSEQPFDASNYFVDTYSRPGRICLATGKIWPVGVRALMGGKVQWTAGAAAIPDRYKHAMKLLVAHWYENREATTVGDMTEVPLGYSALVADRVVSVG